MKKSIMWVVMMLLSVSIISGWGWKHDEDENRNKDNMTQYSLLEKQFHIPYIDILEEKGITLECKSKRNATIKKVEKVLEKKAVYLEKERTWFSGSYFKITNSNLGYLYYGELKNNKPHGFGIILMLDGTEYYYIGEFSKGQFEGYGALFDQANLGDPYLVYDSDRDEYIDSEIESEEVQSYVSNHVTYDGEWNNGERCGEGNRYSGIIDPINSFNELKPTVEGYWSKYFYPETIYTGEYRDDMCDGDIRIYFLDILAYKGKMKDDLYDGKGVIYSINTGEVIYNGRWDEGLYDKKGTLYYANGNIKYKGQWKDGECHGKGTFYNETGEVVYSGKWKDGDYDA